MDQRELSWAGGALAALASNALSSAGLVTQRKAHLRRSACQAQNDDDGDRRGARCYAAGFVVYLAAAPLDVISYALAPELICSTISSFRVAIMAVLAWFFLGESLVRRSLVGMVVCTFGVCMCLWGSPSEVAPASTGSPVTRMFHDRRAGSYLAVGMAVVIALLFVDFLFDYWSARVTRGPALRTLALCLNTGLVLGLEKVINHELGFTQAPSSFLDFQSKRALFVFGIIAFGLLDLFLNVRCVRTLPINVFVPLVEGFRTAIQTFQSFFVLEEFKYANRKSILLSLLGTAFALIGALVMNGNSAMETTQDTQRSENYRPHAETQLVMEERSDLH